MTFLILFLSVILYFIVILHNSYEPMRCTSLVLQCSAVNKRLDAQLCSELYLSWKENSVSEDVSEIERQQTNLSLKGKRKAIGSVDRRDVWRKSHITFFSKQPFEFCFFLSFHPNSTHKPFTTLR